MAVTARKTTKGVVYWVSVRVPGKRTPDNHRIGGDKREAQRANERFKRQVKDGTYRRDDDDARSNVGEYVLDHCGRKRTRTADDDRQRWQKYSQQSGWLCAKRVADITQADVLRWVDELRKSAPTAKTLRNVYGVFSAAMRDAVARGYLDRDPCNLPRGTLPVIRRKRRAIYEPDDVQRLTDPSRVGARAAALFVAAAYTGARRGELCGLRWGDISDAPSLPALRIERTYDGAPLKTAAEEGERERTVPIHPRLQVALCAWRESWELLFCRAPSATDPIFPSMSGGHLSKGGANKAVTAAVRAAGCAERGIHTMRHTFITLARRHSLAEHVEPITHNASGSIVDLYTHWQWGPLCDVILGVDHAASGATQGATRFAAGLFSSVEAPGIESCSAIGNSPKASKTWWLAPETVPSKKAENWPHAPRTAQRVALARHALLYAAQAMGVAA